MKLLLIIGMICAAAGSLGELAAGHSQAGGIWLCAALLFGILGRLEDQSQS